MNRKATCLTLAAGALSFQSFASDELSSISLEDLLNIDVSVASNVITDARKQPVSVSTITADKIRLSGARTVSELLTMFVPGYFLVEDQDDTIAGFRGLVPDNNSKVMLLLNGTNLNTEWFWGPPDAVLNGLDLAFIDRIEVIRGPGSVTLGQGALLGVVNIVTKKGASEQGMLSYDSGADGLTKRTVSARFENEDTSAYIYASFGEYDSEPLENIGWAAARSDQGLTVFERNHHLKRAAYTNFLANISHSGFEANIFRFEQQRDLYNFFRDRESVAQDLEGASLTYKTDISDSVKLTLAAKYMKDDYGLFAHGNNEEVVSRLSYELTGSGFSSIISSVPGLADSAVEPGLTMGGTRETRNGFKALFNWEISENNKAAFGVEYNTYKSGQKDSRGNNFIINEEIQRLGLASDGAGGFIATGSANDNNAWVKPNNFSIKSIFFEDFWTVNDKLDVFGAFRWDSHPDWGSQVSPRVGGFFDLGNDQLLRFTYQTGFRGAVGVQYAGGFVQDGFLAEENFDDVNAIADTIADFDFDGDGSNDTGQLSSVKPETIESIEIAYSKQTESLRFTGVLFFNTVEDILTAQAHGYDGLAFGDTIGTDAVGTWNGNWYYQNQDGKLKQQGIEIEFDYQIGNWILGASHANVQVASADPGTIGVYVLPGEKTAAYPENVTRLHVNYNNSTSFGQVSMSINDLWFWEYDAPTGASPDGAHLINFGASLKPSSMPKLTTSLILKNILDADELYPINGTGNLAGADGAPTIEPRTWWLNVSYQF
ncbi:TonB-dependent receptor plug domain-containing protein [Pleionea sediminis]|uniref:TonB-dependent receptor plug domain-containing protein n=1 Tax=Pleionea sediminis TaxID=2569479 RepID=UPI0013DD89B7|nr:TonB-dependent receptor [Pleionea sediminis]